MHADEEMTEALQDLARLAWRGVPGCEGASISLLRDDAPSSMAASSAQVRAVDEAQYSRGHGPCVSAMRDAREVTVTDLRTEDRWPDFAAAADVRSSPSLPLSRGGRSSVV